MAATTNGASSATGPTETGTLAEGTAAMSLANNTAREHRSSHAHSSAPPTTGPSSGTIESAHPTTPTETIGPKTGPATTLARGASSDTRPKVAAEAPSVAAWHTSDAASVERAEEAIRATGARHARPRPLRRLMSTDVGDSSPSIASAWREKSASAQTESAES